MCVCECLHVCLCPHVKQWPQRTEEGTRVPGEPLYIWVLGVKPVSLGKAESSLNH